MNKTKFFLQIAITAIIILTGCTHKVPEYFDYGHVTNSKYTNSFFGCELLLPKNWSVQTKEQLEKLTRVLSGVGNTESPDSSASVKTSDVNVANLLTFSQYELGVKGKFNPSCAISAKNLSDLPEIKTSGDYIMHTRELLLNARISYTYIDPGFSETEFNGTTFATLNALIVYNGIGVKQTYYSVIKNGFSFNIIISYETNEQREVMLNVLRNMKFDK